MDPVVVAGLSGLLLAAASSCAPNPPVPSATSGSSGSILWKKVVEPREPPDEVSSDSTCRVCVARDSYVARDFSHFYGCPLDQVHMVSNVVTRGALTPPVPPDVAADPDRLAIWNRDHVGYANFDVTGCGVRREYRCILVGGGRSTCSGSGVAQARELEDLSSEERPPTMGIALVPLSGRRYRVVRVDSGSPAEGKLQPDDVIVTVEGAPIAELSDLADLWEDHRGRSLQLDVEREGGLQKVLLSAPTLHGKLR
jgi:hypothetical protein